MAKNVKNQILDSLKWFKAKLTSSIVNNCSSTSTTLPLSAAQGRSLQNQITQQNTKIDKIYFKSIAISQNGNAANFNLSGYREAAIYMSVNNKYLTSIYLDLPMLGGATYRVSVGGIVGNIGTLGIIDFSIYKLSPIYAFTDSQITNLSNVVFYVYAR